MKTIISLSIFSFNKSHFSSFEELEEEFKLLQSIKDDYKQAKVSFAVGNDITDYSYFGLSVNQQIKNFEFGGDRGLQIYFNMKLQREYLKNFDWWGLTTDELIEKSVLEPNIENNENHILYMPIQKMNGYVGFDNDETFASHYEKILSEYPVSNDSYYQRMTSLFTNIIYHSDCRATLNNIEGGDFCKFSISFTQCLKALNDHKAQIRIPEELGIIGHLAGYSCTTQGSNNKENMQFSFPEVSEVNQINCEFHLKPSDSNDPRDNNYYHNRIYFTFAEIDGEVKTLVASIGPHL
jgi:hypothetical protein